MNEKCKNKIKLAYLVEAMIVPEKPIFLKKLIRTKMNKVF